MEIKCEFILVSERFPVKRVYQKIGISSGELHTNEETIIKTIANEEFRKPPETSITYSTTSLGTIQILDVVKEMVAIIYPKRHIIRKLTKKYGVSTSFCITLNITEEPEMFLPKDFIQLASYLNASIEFDTYLDIDKVIEYDEEKDT